jgi:hypothetical protein
MRHFNERSSGRHALVCYFRGDSDSAIHSRSVSESVWSAVLDVPAPPARQLADWNREALQQMGLAPGDVETLPLARTRMRWPDLKVCVQAASDWTRSLGLQAVLASSELALMACRGARYHHDGAHYGAAAFCNLFLSPDQGLDLHFPSSGHRIPLTRGTAVIFDTAQPHAVVARGASAFDAAHFAAEPARTPVFLSWEMAIEDPLVAKALQIAFNADPVNAARLDDEQVWCNGARTALCPVSGQWLSAH